MTTVTLDFDDEDLFRIHGICQPSTHEFQPLQPIASGLSAVSSIGRAEKETAPLRHRPQLEPPRHYMLDLLDLHREVEEVLCKEISVFKTQSKADLAEIERLQQEKDEALRKNAEDAASRNNWTVLGNVAQYLAAGTSIAVGLSLGPTAWGTLLLTSGVVGLGNRAVRDTMGWQSVAAWLTKSAENQKRLVQQIEMGFLAVELGTGLFGGMGACTTGAFSALAADTTRLLAAKKAATAIQGASTSMRATSQLGKTFFDKRVDDLRVRMQTLDAHVERIRMEMNQQVTSARSMIDTVQACGQELHKAIAASEIHDL